MQVDLEAPHQLDIKKNIFLKSKIQKELFL